MSTPSTGSKTVEASTYDIGFGVFATRPGDLHLVVGTLPVLAAEFLQNHGYHMLIGRDVLAQCILTYNGADGYFLLAY
jgi:hypothetical protein